MSANHREAARRWAGRVLPETNGPASWRRCAYVLRRASLARTLYLSVRYHGRIVISRRTRLRLGPGARIDLSRGSFLFVGFANLNPTPCAVHIGRQARLSVDGTVSINRGCRVSVNDGAHLHIGNRSYINDNSSVVCFESISIGVGCAIAWNTNILDANIHALVVEGEQRPRSQPIAIGDQVWLGTGAIVLPGVTIGSGAVVAAGSVVRSDVPARTVVAGNPARVVRERISWQP
jgi:acetyltransferase-like isoleucine patch superfamily enzyme